MVTVQLNHSDNIKISLAYGNLLGFRNALDRNDIFTTDHK